MERLGRYEIVNELGHGAMGTVYRARDPKIDRIVALKTISVAGIAPADEEEYRQRFFREAQAAGKLSHGGIVTIHDVGEDEATKTPFIVMEFIEGQTLETLGRGERLPTATTLELVKQVAEALDYAQGHQIVHRDIKPANIIVTPDGRAKITDFGIAKLQLTQFTQPGQVLGTPAYMSPEQLTGGAVDGRSDLFSLGVILYWLLTGDKPFAGDTTTAVSFKIVYQDPVPPTQLNPALSPDCDYLVARALAKDPASRYQRGREVAQDLEDLKFGRPLRSRTTPAAAPVAAEIERTVAAQPPAPPVPPTATVKTKRLGAPVPAAPVKTKPLGAPPTGVVPPPEKKRGWVLPAAAAAVVLLLLVGAGWWWSRRSSAKKAEPEQATVQEAAPPASPSPARPRATPRSQPRSERTEPRLAEPRTRQGAMATLRLRGEHNFETATLYVYSDEKLIRELHLSGATTERKGARIGFGRISAEIPVPAGRHSISIRIKAPADDFDQIEYIQSEFEAGQIRTLEISLGKLGKYIGIGELTRKLTLRWLD